MQRAIYGMSRRLGDVEFLSAQFTGHRFPPHSHPVFAVGTVRSGSCRIWHGGACHPARRGDLVLMDPDAPHSAASAADRGYCAIYFSIAAARERGGRLPPHPGFGVVVGRDRDGRGRGGVRRAFPARSWPTSAGIRTRGSTYA